MAIDDPPPLPRQLRDQRFQPLGAGPVEAGEGLVEQQHAGVLDQRPGDQDALALAAGEAAEGLLGERPEADAVERPRRRLALGADPGAATRAGARACPSSPRRAPRRGSRAASARSGEPCRRSRRRAASRRSARSSPSTARSSVVLPPPLGPSRASVCPAARENSTPEIAAVAVVAGAEAGGLDQGSALHPRLPPVKPRTIALALAASICR